MQAKNEQNQVEVEGAHEAANAADTKHPHHYDPAKQDIKTEEELQAEAADNPRSNGSPGSQVAAQAATRVDVETTHFHGEEPVRAQPPEEFTGIKFSSVKNYAGGVPAVVSVMQHSLKEMGVVRSTKTLLQVNQKGGFDCIPCRAISAG